MDARTKPAEYVNSLVLSHRKELARVDDLSKPSVYSLLKRHLWLVETGRIRDPSTFINAMYSDDIRVKIIGYRGASMIEGDETVENAVLAILQDIKDPRVAKYVLTYLGVLNEVRKDAIFPILYDLSRMEGYRKLRSRAMIIEYKIRGGVNDLKFNDRSEYDTFVKLQIVLSHAGREDVDISHLTKSEEVLKLFTMFRRTNKPYIRMLIIQVLSILHRKGAEMDQNFVKHVEDSINLIKVLGRRFVEMACFVEYARFLLECGYKSSKPSSLVFKLMESHNENLVIEGCRIAVEYGIYEDIALEKCLLLGLEYDDVLKMFTTLMNASNYRRVYERRESILEGLLAKGVNPSTANTVMQKTLGKVSQFVDPSDLVSLYLSNPRVCAEIPAIRRFDAPTKRKLASAVEGRADVDSIAMFYQVADPSSMSFDLVRSHISAALNARIDLNDAYYCKHLCAMLLAVRMLDKSEDGRNTILDVFRYIYEADRKHYLLPIVAYYVASYNEYLSDMMYYIGDGVFLNYNITKSKSGGMELSLSLPKNAECFLWADGFRVKEILCADNPYGNIRRYKIAKYGILKVEVGMGTSHYECIIRGRSND